MKIFSKIKHLSKKIIAVGVVVAAVSGLMALKTASADVSVSTPVDCDTNAVIRCGATSTATLVSKYTSGDGVNSAASIHNIYSAFGITSTEVTGMRTTAVAGTVTKSGEVFANGELVATGAVTAGRGFIPGSTKVVFNGTTFYKRAPSVSFRSASLQAYVVMVNGKFSHAVLASCGNPVNATPKTPNFAIAKTVRVKGQSSWVKAVTVNPGAHVEYRVVVSSTGQVSVKNVIARDTLPTNVTYVDNTLRRDGAVVAADSNFFSAAGNLITSLAPGKSVSYTFEAIVGAKDTVSSCVPQTLVNTGIMTSPGLPTKSDTANVSKVCLPKPVFSCDSLTASQVSRAEFNFTAKANAANGAVITGYKYDFGDSKNQTVTTSATTNTTAHTYAAPGTYNASVAALVNVDNVVKEVTSANCKTTVVVVAAPAAECTDLTLTRGTGRNVTANVTFTTSGGATLKNIDYNFGDNTAVVDTTQTSVDHTFAADGTFTVKATLTFNGAEAVAPSTCQANITINTVTPAFSCDAFDVTKGDNRMITVSKLTFTATGGATFKNAVIDWGDSTAPLTTVNAVGQTHTFAVDDSFTVQATVHFMVAGEEVTDSGNCSKTVVFSPTPPPQTPPQVLPSTGPSGVIGIFAGTSVLASLGYYMIVTRRTLRG